MNIADTDMSFADMTSAEIAATLHLEAHPEGGFFRETYRSDSSVMTVRGPRAASTAILFLLTVARPSRFHRLASDELWLCHGGAVIELITLLPDGSAGRTLLAVGGQRRHGGLIATPQAIVPGGCWQAARVMSGEGVDWGLVSCAVSPGFIYEDFELAERDELLAAYPDQAKVIAALT